MLKRRKELIRKLLVLSVCTSLVQTTIAFATVETANVIIGSQENILLNDSGENGEWVFNGTYETFNNCNINKITFHINKESNTASISRADSTISGTINLPNAIIANGNKYTVRYIDEYAFKNCTNLENVSIPTGVKYVPQGMFENCSNLKTVVIPSSVNEELWGQVSAFANCSSLEKIEVNEGNTIYKSIDGVLYNKAGTKIVIYPAAKNGESYKIPDNVVSIMKGAFTGCKNLRSVEITDNVIEINNDAFSGCSGLQTVKMPNNIKAINSNTFYGCSNLINIAIPSSVTSIKTSAFEGCSSLTNITIPSNVTNISSDAFKGCNNLTNITIPSNIAVIGSSAFQDCTNLTTVIMPNSISNIGTNAFANCDKENLIFWVPNNYIRLLLINANVDSSKIRIGTGSSEITKVNSIELNTTNLNWTVGQAGTFTVTILPNDATDKTVTWTSSDTNIATVDNNGVVTAKANGNVTITATANDGSGVKGTKTITVGEQSGTTPTEIKVTGITINGSNIISTKAGTITLTPNILPSTASNKTVTWTSSNPSVATVSDQGVVTAISNGSAIITATAADGSKIAGTKVITVTGQTTTSNNSSDSVLQSASISGTEEVGHTLKAKVKYNGTKPELQYQWQRASKKDGDYTDISGADEEEYKLKSSDRNKYIKLIVSATINGTNYNVEDITSKIDRDTSDDDDNDSSNSSSSSSSNTYNNSNDIGILRPSNTTNNSPNSMISNTSTTNSSSPANGVFTNPAGHPISGWVSSSDKWYYLDNNGHAQVGWINDNGKWYYFNTSGDSNRAAMKTGWVQDNGKWYYLDQCGAMVTNTTIDGYRLGRDGAMI